MSPASSTSGESPAWPGGPTRQDLAKWLRRQREARSWSRPHIARLLIDAARAKGDTQIPDQDGMTHNVYRWEYGSGTVSERYRFLYCQVLSILPEAFGHAEPDPGVPAFLGSDTHGKSVSAIVIFWVDGTTTTMRCQ